LFTSDYL